VAQNEHTVAGVEAMVLDTADSEHDRPTNPSPNERKRKVIDPVIQTPRLKIRIRNKKQSPHHLYFKG